MTNEQLCSLAREGDKAAEAALIENVLPSIRITAANILPDDYNKNPEQLFIRKETITEVRNALGEISDRERAYLHYRYGFLDCVLHDQSETAAHFHLSLSRAT